MNTTFNSAETDPYNFRKPPTRPPPSASHFPPPPRRSQTTKDFNSVPNPRFTAPTGRNAGSTAPGVEKFKAFTKATPQQWDRAKFDEAARADAARGFQYMKSTRGSTGQQMPPPPPTRPPRAPTAPRTNAFDSSSTKDDQPAGFPGMSRPANMRRSGFDPSTPGPDMDEQHAPHRPSAYASYSRGERPGASNAHGYFPEGVSPNSPPMVNKKPAVSPLRHVRSESGWDPPKLHRPEFERVSSRYANTPGERTNPNGGLGRSASVRTSPVEKHWDDSDVRNPSGRPHSHQGPTRNQSSSPRLRPSGVPIIDYSSSSSDSSEDDRPSLAPRRKAQARRPRVHTSSSDQHGYRPSSDNDPALTGHFPSSNYTKIVEDKNSSQYSYPPPDDGPVRRPFSNMPSPESVRPGMNGNGLHPDDGISKYDPLHSFSQPMRSARAGKTPETATFRRRLASWQVPSSVMPGLVSPLKRHRMDSIPEERSSTLRGWLSEQTVISDFELDREPWKADDLSLNSQRRPDPEHLHSTNGASNPHSVSEENVNSKFAAADWEGKFGSGDEFLRPNIDTSDRDRRSPTRSTRPRARSTGKVKLNAQGHVQENVPPMPSINGHKQGEAANGATQAQSGSDGDFQFVNAQELPKSAAFQPAKFSADKWTKEFNEQKWSTPTIDLTSRTPKSQRKQSRPMPRKQTSTTTSAGEPSSTSNNENTAYGDAMDIDGDSMENLSSNVGLNSEQPVRDPTAAAPTENDQGLNINLEDLKKTAPFAPSATGLKDLHDLSNAIPFESRAAPSVDPLLNRTISSTARRLNLPKPPKTVIPPAEDRLTQEAWSVYINNITIYFHEWNVFNVKMIDHFRSRQDQISINMRNNWISGIGDGPSAETFDTAKNASQRAGFATYMSWLEDDAQCRSWWNHANERHRECFENVARLREIMKKRVGLV